MATGDGRGGKREGSGRPKGAPNRRKQEVIDKLEAMDCDPIEGMARIAQEALNEGNYALAGSMFKELAPYMHAKKTAQKVEVSGGLANYNVNQTIDEDTDPAKAAAIYQDMISGSE